MASGRGERTVPVILACLVPFLLILTYLAVVTRRLPALHRATDLLLIVSQILIICFAAGIEYFDRIGLGATVSFVVLTVVCCAIDVLVMRDLRCVEDQRVAAQGLRFIDEQLEAQRQHLAHAQACLEETGAQVARSRAELEQTLLTLQKGDTQPVCGDAELPGEAAPPPRRLCEHNALEALAITKERRCQELGIALTMRLDVPANVPISAIDLCAVVANMLDNAIESCLLVRQREQRPVEIELDVVAALGWIDVAMRNSCLHDLKIPSYRATGLAEHGWGLSIVERLAAKHDGDFSWQAEDGVFTMDVRMRLA